MYRQRLCGIFFCLGMNHTAGEISVKPNCCLHYGSFENYSWLKIAHLPPGDFESAHTYLLAKELAHIMTNYFPSGSWMQGVYNSRGPRLGNDGVGCDKVWQHGAAKLGSRVAVQRGRNKDAESLVFMSPHFSSYSILRQLSRS